MFGGRGGHGRRGGAAHQGYKSQASRHFPGQMGGPSSGYAAPSGPSYASAVDSTSTSTGMHVNGGSDCCTPHRDSRMFWSSKDLRSQMLAEKALFHTCAPQSTHPPLPDILHGRYHSLLVLRSPEMSASQQGPGYMFSRHPLYKTVDAECAEMRFLRRISGMRSQLEMQLFPLVEFWRTVRHPNVVRLVDAFLTSEFPDISGSKGNATDILSGAGLNSIGSSGSSFGGPTGNPSQLLDLCLIYEMHPFARTLQELFIPAVQTAASVSATAIPVTEELLWSISCQLLAGVRAIHVAGGACRILCPSKVIMSHLGSPSCSLLSSSAGASKPQSQPAAQHHLHHQHHLLQHQQQHHRNHQQSSFSVSNARVRISCAGFGDLFAPNKHVSVVDAQREDLVQIGTTLLSVATGTNAGTEAMITSGGSRESYSKFLSELVERMRRDFSAQLVEFVIALASGRLQSVFEAFHMISDRILMHADQALAVSDALVCDMSREIENGRLFRLISKLCMITERPDHEGDAQWAETGDRYLIKLFRDYVFHQCDENGNPIVDLGHITECLNKLDASSEEKVCMMSRDGQNLLVASFADLKRSFDNAFGDLVHNRN
eukprot:ANDGO_00172.mRNA.1 PAB-dependent poly(A)-specific ribonuclease subunit PAN3